MSSTQHSLNDARPASSTTARGSRWASLLLALLLAAFVFTFIYAGYLIFHWARGVVAQAAQLPAVTFSDFPINDPMDIDAAAPQAAGTPDPNAPITAVEPVPTWDVSKLERVNILLLGVDQRPSQTIPGLTDTMMLVTIDPAHGQVGMLSIPRDTWVKIPAYEIYNKINTAHRFGEVKDYPGGGPALAKQTVSDLIGYPVHYYVRVNFDGFREIIDLVGGVYIDVPRDLSDPTYPDENYGYDPLFIPAGRQLMDGTLALKYARTRHVDNDFERGRRQQQVILALRDKVLSQDMLPTLIRNLPALVRSLSQSIQTDVPLDRLITLAEIGRQVDFNQVEQAVIDCSLGECTYSEAGAWILIPDRNKIRAVVDRLFAEPVVLPVSTDSVGVGSGSEITATVPVTSTLAPEDLRQRLQAENARILVLNGTNTKGLARRVADWLEAQGFIVANIGDAERSNYQRASLISYNDKPATLTQLAILLGVGASEVRNSPPDEADIDIRLVVGEDTLAILEQAGVK
jgi:LCP family protein required for cell wall assembly